MLTHLFGGRFLITFLVAGQQNNACTCSFSSVWFPQLEHKASIKLPFQKCGSLWKGRLLSPIRVVSCTLGCQEVEFQGKKLSRGPRRSWQPGCCSTAGTAPCWGQAGERLPGHQLGLRRGRKEIWYLLACLGTASCVETGRSGVLRCVYSGVGQQQSPVGVGELKAAQIPSDSSRGLCAPTGSSS